jgi:hypothetical protein
MKTRSSRSKKSAPNQLICDYGTARFYEKPKAQSKWADPKIPEMMPNWLVRFHVGGKTWVESAGPTYRVSQGIGPVKKWAETLMRTHWQAAHAGKLEEMEAVVRPARLVTLAELLKVYLQKTPPNKPDYAKNAQKLRMIMEEVSGLDASEIMVSDEWFSTEVVRDWARLRQEHFRRGWTVRGAAPVNAWQLLRSDLKAGRLPGLDKTTVMECNTTILSYLRCSKAIFANNREYLGGLVLPKLADFLGDGSKRNPGASVSVAVPKGYRQIDDQLLHSIAVELPKLQSAKPQVWAFVLTCAWLAGRPGKVAQLRGDALAVLPDGTGVITQPGAKGGNVSHVSVDANCVAALNAVRHAESLFGARSRRAMELIYRESNQWLTDLGLEGTKKLSIFRHHKLNILRNRFDDEMAAAAAGHTTTAMVRSTYTRNEKVVPIVDPFAIRSAG